VTRRKLAELYFDAAASGDRCCIVQHALSGVTGYGATFEAALADLRVRTGPLPEEAPEPLDFIGKWRANFL
jgi:hypothetical protein